MGEAGIQTVEHVLPNIREQHAVDVVIAQAENVTNGRGLSLKDFERLRTIGIDFCTGGNWTGHLSEINGALNDPNVPIIRPANYPADTPGKGWKFLDAKHGKILVVSLLGHIVGKDAEKTVDNPLLIIDEILRQTGNIQKIATVVNFHGDYSSEKRMIGYYLDGRASLVVGDHWHVPTADARVQPGGTAHMTDAGMCGVLNSSLGVTYDSIIPRW